ncbi:hypothetical protein FHR81_004839 [Actinoalloteichus hoggarensis]|uniref:DNA-binding protein n=1 Tax=Actinoalloteichus hoggarensis TaxID=1470176 RepID=A0A221W841_9PSEU|nr:Rv2175c family DNA-binding protein [Actinoalloteichus hoggarensis]ASO22152.1 DNA-binding protein [Actinoalloteichus hoggarensis]MBB5923766.1 hypothetical protein [Actinoalloteichus hoggarensis]
MSEFPTAPDVLDPEVEVLPLPDVADRLGVPFTRVHQMLRDGLLLALRRDGIAVVPAAFLTDDTIVKGLPGTVTVLRDGGFSHAEILRWMFTEDETLPGTPLTALRENRGREVRRRAQAMAF